MSKEKKPTITCLGCPFYSGIQCHGHGEYWGNCNKLEEVYKILETRIGKDQYIASDMKDICFDDSECKFLAWAIFDLRRFK